MAIFSVASLAEFNVALASARGGDTIAFAPGVYDGFVSVSNRFFEPPLTITSADPENPAQFSGNMWVRDVTGLKLENVDFKFADAAKPGWMAQLHISGGQNIEVHDVSVEGRLAKTGEGASPDGFADAGKTGWIEGHAIGLGVVVRGSADVVLEEVEVSVVERGVTFMESSDVKLVNSHLHDIRKDGLVITSSSSISVEDNLFDSFRPYSSSTNRSFKDHSDFIQFFAYGTPSGIDGLTISGNAFLQGNGESTQGVFGWTGIKGETPDHISFKNFVVTDNIFNLSTPNAITLGEVQSAEVRGNILIPAPQDVAAINRTDNVPRITVSPDKRHADPENPVTLDIRIGENVIVASGATTGAKIDGIDPKEFAAKGIVLEGDTVLSANPADPNWYGAVFPGAADEPVLDLEAVIAAAPGGSLSIADWIIEAVAAIPATRPNEKAGGDGSDVLVAESGGSRLSGGAGDDALTGGAGMDVIVGGAGSDRMTGGARGDVFALTASAPGKVDTDVIVDLDFAEGDSVIFGEGFPFDIFLDGADPDNPLLVMNGGSRAVLDSDADIQELLDSSEIRLGASRPEDVLLEFDLNRDGKADYRLLLEGYAIGRNFTDGSFTAPRPGAGEGPTTFDFSSVLQLYADKTTKSVSGPLRLVVAGDGGELLLGSALGDTLIGGAGSDVLLGAEGNDYLITGGGADRVLLDASLPGETDTIVDIDFASGDVVEIFHPLLPELAGGAQLSSLTLGSGGASFLIDGLAALAELARFGLAELDVTAGATTLRFALSGGAVYSVQLHGMDAAKLQSLIDDPDPDLGPIVTEAALPDFDAGEHLVIEGMPAGYFAGSGLPAPEGVTDGSAVEIGSIADLHALIGSALDIVASPDGADRLELSLRVAGEEYVSLTLVGLEEVSSYKLAFGDPGAPTTVATEGRDTLAIFGSMDKVVLALGGDDYIRVTRGDDWVDGGAGNDSIQGEIGSDTLIGGAGADRFTVFGNLAEDGDRDVLADVDFTEGDVIVFMQHAVGLFAGGVRRGTMVEIDSADDLLALENAHGVTLERGEGSEVIIEFVLDQDRTTWVHVWLDKESLSQFDEVFLA